MLRTNSKSLGNPCSQSRKKERKGCGGKDLQKRKVPEWVGIPPSKGQLNTK